jgi:uncharacterized protein (DUF1330 family)
MPKGYWIASIAVKDPERYKDYVATAVPAYQRHGAKFLVRGGAVHMEEGAPRKRNVVIEFPSIEEAIACYNSPEYTAAKAIRQSVSEGDIVIVEGFEP